MAGDDLAQDYLAYRGADQEALEAEAALERARKADRQRSFADMLTGAVERMGQGQLQTAEAAPEAAGTVAQVAKDTAENLVVGTKRGAQEIESTLARAGAQIPMTAAAAAQAGVQPEQLGNLPEPGDPGLPLTELMNMIPGVEAGTAQAMNWLTRDDTENDLVAQKFFQYASPFFGYLKALGTVNVGRPIANALSADALTAVTAIEPHFERFADFLQTFEAVHDTPVVGPFIDYVASRDGPESEERFKNLVDAMSVAGIPATALAAAPFLRSWYRNLRDVGFGSVAPGTPARQAGAIMFHGGRAGLKRFERDFIGTGTGKLSRGHGIYLTREREVAEGIARIVGEDRGMGDMAQSAINGQPLERFMGTLPEDERVLFEAAWADFADGFRRGISDIEPGEDFAEAFRQYLTQQNSPVFDQGDVLSPAAAKPLAGKIESLTTGGGQPTSEVIEVELPDDVIDRMLHHDRLLDDQGFDPPTEQIEALKAKASELGIDISGLTAGGAYNQIARFNGGPARTSELFAELGITGFRYRDDVRGIVSGEVQNFVVFDPDVLTIQRPGEGAEAAGRPLTEREIATVKRSAAEREALRQELRDLGFGDVSEEALSMSREELGRQLQSFSLADEAQPPATTFTPIAEAVPEGTRQHGLPAELLVPGGGEKATTLVTSSPAAATRAKAYQNVRTVLEAHPNALDSETDWLAMQAEAFGGDALPAPPYRAIEMRNDPQQIVDTISQLTPEMRASADEGFRATREIGALYEAGTAAPEITAETFVWGLLSRGAGPFQQEGAFIDILAAVEPLVNKAAAGRMTQADVTRWRKKSAGLLKTGSPGRQVTHNVNQVGELLLKMGSPNEQGVVPLLEINRMLNAGAASADIRRAFFELVPGAGIDNKVVSFIMLVSGRDDVLVLDRIQSRHLWDDGRFGGQNIYDGLRKKTASGQQSAEGLVSVLTGPRGTLITESLERGLQDAVSEAYGAMGREADASLGRFHWESWLVQGEQTVEHSTLRNIATGESVGAFVREGKPNTVAAGAQYIRTPAGQRMFVPTSDGALYSFTPGKFQKTVNVTILKKRGIIPRDFKISEHTRRPWYESEEVDREALDALIRREGKAAPGIAPGTAEAGQDPAATRRRRRTAPVTDPDQSGGGQ